MRAVYYVFLFAFLFSLLCCVNLVRWLIIKFQLALLSVRRWPPHRGTEWRRETVMKDNRAKGLSHP
jgi:hypothetical protein